MPTKPLPGVAIYHRVFAHETFEEAATKIFELIKKAQETMPGRGRFLYLDIDGHRNPVGGFDHDMLELQAEFMVGFLMPWLKQAVMPLADLANPKRQRNDLPEMLEIKPAQKARRKQ